MKNLTKLFVLVLVFTLSACGNKEELDAQKAQVAELNDELKNMQSLFEEFKQNQEEKSKTELDATGIAIVDYEELRNKYIGYKVAIQKLQNKYNSLKEKLENQASDFQRRYQTFEQSAKYLDAAKVQTEGAKFQTEYQELQKQQYEADGKLAEEEQTLTKDVMTKVNAHLKQYAEQNGYQMVLFTAVENGIFYAKDQINITEEYIENLNEAYNNGFK